MKRVLSPGQAEEADVAPGTRRSMQGNRGKDTAPEMVVRRLVHAMGYRYRLHRKDLPGKPDMAFGPRRAIIEVRGCFWHRHPGCVRASMPNTRRDFWQQKFAANITRDARNEQALVALNWRVLIVWECETSDLGQLGQKVRAFLGSKASSGV